MYAAALYAGGPSRRVQLGKVNGVCFNEDPSPAEALLQHEGVGELLPVKGTQFDSYVPGLDGRAAVFFGWLPPS